jgi:hypothetical protein
MRKKLLLFAVSLPFFGTDPLGLVICRDHSPLTAVEGPQISCPAPTTVDATGPLGAVTFTPAATDNWSAPVASVPAPRDKAINASDADAQIAKGIQIRAVIGS